MGLGLKKTALRGRRTGKRYQKFRYLALPADTFYPANLDTIAAVQIKTAYLWN
jgi:hypothetical protein